MRLNRKGFTLVELLVTIVIIALVIGFSTFGIISAVNNSKNKATVLSTNSLKKAANVYSTEASSDSWKKTNSDYDAFCVTVGELMNKGLLDKDGIISDDSITKETFIIVKRNNITFAVEDEEIAYLYDENYNICTKNDVVAGEIFTRPVMGEEISYTDRMEISFESGTSDTGVKDYKCLFGTSSSNVNREGVVDKENNICIIDGLKNNTFYYVYIYMNTNGGSSVLAEGTKEYLTNDFSASTFDQELNTITINYNDSYVYKPSHYFLSNNDGKTNTNVEKCVLNKNNVFICDGIGTNEIKSDTWYKTLSDDIVITYPEETNTIEVKARIYDGSNNFREDSNTFKINKYTVLFYKNNASSVGGSSDTYVSRYCIAAGDDSCVIKSLSIEPPIGYYAVGWNTNSNATSSQWDAQTDKNIKSDYIYYAIIKAYKVNIKYNVNGGVITTPTTDSDGTVNNWTTNNGIIYKNGSVLQDSCSYDETIYTSTGLANYNNTSYINITRTGYNVISNNEWKCLSGCTIANRVFDQVTSYNASDFCDASYNHCTVVIGVNWVANTYMVKYNANGGTGTTSSSSHTYGVAKQLTKNGFSRPGYTFIGWSTSSSGSAVYSDEQSVSNLTSTNGETVNLYAVWKANTYTITYDANGGSGAPSNQTANAGVATTLSSTIPVQVNYIFGGWNTSKNYTGTTYASGSSYNGSSDVTLYAVWTAHTHSWTAIGNTLRTTGTTAHFTCGYAHTKAYARYCSDCGMSYYYYRHVLKLGSDGTLSCPCEHGAPVWFDDSSLTWKQVQARAGTTGGQASLTKLTSSPTALCSEHS